MTTVGELRQFATDAAEDVADVKGDRLVNRWGNQALRGLQREHPWKHFRAYQRIATAPAEDGSRLNLTEGSLVVTLGGAEAFLQKYVDDRWDLIVEGGKVLRLASFSTAQSGLLTSGYQWPYDSATDQSYQWSKYSYELTTPAQRILQIQEEITRRVVQPMVPDQIDFLRHENPGQLQSWPDYYCVRGTDRIDLWPSLDTTRSALGITYQRFVTPFTEETDEDTEVDWPGDLEDLLFAAVLLEISTWRGTDAKVPYAVAFDRYRKLLAKATADDADRQHQERSMNPSLPLGWDHRRGRFHGGRLGRIVED